MATRKLSYYEPILQHEAFEAEVTNRASCVEIKLTKGMDNNKYKSVHDLRAELLYGFVRPYSRINPNRIEDRKKLAIHLQEDIKSLEEQILDCKMALQLCKKKDIKLVK